MTKEALEASAKRVSIGNGFLEFCNPRYPSWMNTFLKWIYLQHAIILQALVQSLCSAERNEGSNVWSACFRADIDQAASFFNGLFQITHRLIPSPVRELREVLLQTGLFRNPKLKLAADRFLQRRPTRKHSTVLTVFHGAIALLKTSSDSFDAKQISVDPWTLLLVGDGGR